MVAEKIETLVVFIEGEKKLKPPGAHGRRDEIPPEGSAWAPGGFNFFFFAFHEYHQSFNFFCQHFREYHLKEEKIINEIQVTKIKKYAWSLLKSCFGDILDKNTAARKNILILVLKYWINHCNL